MKNQASWSILATEDHDFSYINQLDKSTTSPFNAVINGSNPVPLSPSDNRPERREPQFGGGSGNRTIGPKKTDRNTGSFYRSSFICLSYHMLMASVTWTPPPP